MDGDTATQLLYKHYGYDIANLTTVEEIQRFVPLPGDVIVRCVNDEGYKAVFPEIYMKWWNEENSHATVWKQTESFEQKDQCRNVRVGKDSLLFCACRSGCPLNVIKYIHETDPDAISEQSKGIHFYGEYPLHAACYGDDSDDERVASLESIQYLVDAYPAAAMSNDNEHKDLPLHNLLYYASETQIEKVKFLVEEYPEALEVKNSEGKFPLHKAAETRAASREVLKFLVAKCPEALGWKDWEMDTPLDRAIYCRLSMSKIITLIRPFPDAFTAGEGGQMRRYGYSKEEIEVAQKAAKLAKQEIALKGVCGMMG